MFWTKTTALRWGTTPNMLYRELSGYKYQLMETISFYVGIFPDGQLDIKTDYLYLGLNGHLCIKAGYCWDGATDPAVDTQNNLTPSLVHDAGYQLIRMGMIRRSTKKDWDNLFIEMCRVRGMSKLRRSVDAAGLKYFAGGAIEPNPERDGVKIRYAP